MASVSVPFRKEKSIIFGEIFRPVAKVLFWSKKWQKWEEVWMIVDSGADYTILPGYLSKQLGVDLVADCKKYKTGGIGGEEFVYLFRNQKVKLGAINKVIPVGFLASDDVPPLLGRQNFLEEFKVVFESHKTTFS